MRPQTSRCVVIGAGIVGLCVADALLDRGFEVIVLERDQVLGEGCSYGNGGIVVPSHFVPLASPDAVRAGLKMLLDSSSPFGIRGVFSLETLSFLYKFVRAATPARVAQASPLLMDLNLASRGLYQDLITKFDARVGFEQRGLLMLCSTEAGLVGEQHLAEDAEKLGLKVEILDKQGIRQLESEMEINAMGGVFFHDDAHLTPPAFMQALLKQVETKGGQIRTGAEVSGFLVENEAIKSVVLGQEKLEADEVVLCAGVWSGHLARMLNLKMPLLAGKGYGFTLADAPKPKHPAISVESRIAVTPMLDGLRFVGTLELGPNDHSISPKRLAAMKRNITSFYPDIKPKDDLQVWSGLRPCTPDGLPYLGRSEELSNLVIAAGHAMMGMSLGPITGKLVSEIIAGDKPSFDLALLSPDRYD
ncbi:MAG TPA: FAD-dependent oxidoreductase [Fimbriimonadaceae bacterium]